MAVKKSAETKAAPKKSGGKKVQVASPLTLTVPQGGQIIGTFTLTPVLPAPTAAHWKLVDTSTGQEVSSLSVSFNLNSTDVQKDFERAVLVVNILDGGSARPGHWRFVLNGVEAGESTSDVHHDVATEITNQGTTLVAYIHALDLGSETINYGYTASFTDAASGTVTIYESQDPGIIIHRP